MGRHLWHDLPPDEPRRYGATLEARERCARCGLLLLWRRKKGVVAVFATVRTPGRPRSPILVRWADPPGCIVKRCEWCDAPWGGPHAQGCALRHAELAALVPLLPAACQEDLLTLHWERTREDGILHLTGSLVGDGRTGFCNDMHQVAGKRRFAARYSAPRAGDGYHLFEIGVWKPRIYSAFTRSRLLLDFRARVPTRLVL